MTIDECLTLVVMRKVINGIGEEEKIALKLIKFIKKIYNNYNFCIYQRSPAELESIAIFKIFLSVLPFLTGRRIR